ncbi:MAG: flagellar hook assembly protein FlgD [Armatimonadota bacterium]
MKKCLAVPVLLCLLQFMGGVANAMPNMWSTGQPISASMTESPAGTVHAPGTKSYTITATDTDTAFPNYVGPVPDTLTYAWTATKGTISGGANATWTIPADVRGLISCQVVIDDVATMPPGDFGARNDNPITLARNMVVPYANAQFEEFSTNMYGVATIRFKLSSLGVSRQLLAVDYQEQASSFHQCDWTPILTSTNTAQVVSTTTDADGVVNQIYELTWNTLGLHNADYQLRLKADYNCNCHQTTYRSFEQTRTVNVKNLDITTCNPNGNVDYLRWDPDQNLADTTIRSTLEDNGGTSGTTLSINIYHSDRTAYPNPVKTVTVTTDSNPVKNYTWDGKDGSEATCPPGIYLFTVNASHTDSYLSDSVSDRAADAFIVEDRLVDVDGPELRQVFEAKVSGMICNSKLAQFNDMWQEIGVATIGASVLGSATVPPMPPVTSDWLPVGEVLYTKPIQTELVFFSGYDGTPQNDKCHKARPVLGMNHKTMTMSINVYIGDDDKIRTDDASFFWDTMMNTYGYVSWYGIRLMLKPGFHQLSFNGPRSRGVFPTKAKGYTVVSGLQYGWCFHQMTIPTGILFFTGHGTSESLGCQDITEVVYRGGDMLGVKTSFVPMPSLSSSIPHLAVLMSCNSIDIYDTNTCIAKSLQQNHYTTIGTKSLIKASALPFIKSFISLWYTKFKLDINPASIATVVDKCQDFKCKSKWAISEMLNLQYECLEAL